MITGQNCELLNVNCVIEYLQQSGNDINGLIYKKIIK